MNDEQRFCPICRGFHDPDFTCTDRAGSVLRAAGIERKPMNNGELQKTIKSADRSMLILLLVILVAVVFFFFYFS